MVFPILWTLDLLSLGFNFCPLLVFYPRGSSHVIRNRVSRAFNVCVTMLGSRCRREIAQCDSNHEPRPCQRGLLSFSFLFFFFFLYLYYSELVEYISQWDDEVGRIELSLEKTEYRLEGSFIFGIQRLVK